MGYFDGMVANAFKTDAQGNHYVFPFGALGKGRRFRTEQDYLRARRSLKTAYIVGFILMMAMAVSYRVGGWIPVLIIGAVLLVGTIACYPLMLRNSDPADVRQTFAEQLERSGKAHNGVLLGLLFGVSALLTIGGAFLVTRGEAIGYACLAFFGFGTIIFGIMLMKRDGSAGKNGR